MYEHYVELTPTRLALFQLLECADLLDRSEDEPFRLLFAAKAAHLALQSALTAALSGATSIGAYGAKTREKWLRYFEESRVKEVAAPTDTYVMRFADLLEAAQQSPVGTYLTEPLAISEDDGDLLGRLTFLRHAIEHVQPGVHLIEPLYIWQCIPPAVTTAAKLLNEAVQHHLEPDDIALLELVCSRIEARTVEALATSNAAGVEGDTIEAE